MTAPTWTRVRDVFERAVDLPRDEGTALIARELEGEDRALAERMLAAEVVEDAFLEPPTSDELPVASEPEPLERLGSRIESYTLRGLIAAGGMGAVYEAEQQEPRRRVALKLMRAGLASPSSLRRFRDEAALLARLRHPGIAQVYEAGVHVQGEDTSRLETPWFAMELVEGARTITAYAKEQRLALPERLDLFRIVCAAVLHGHQRGVVHRDLKPANLLVDREGHPKVIDFGVAKVTDAEIGTMTGQTQQGELVGTLLYMSPEQIDGQPSDVDTRTDVYALGAVLYELVSDEPPFELDGLSLTQVGRMLCEEEPPSPSRRKPELPRDLDWIVAKAMAKDRDRRYGSPSELSEDLGRFLRHEPVLAGPPSATYQLRKFVRRHRVGAAAAAVALLAIVGGLIGTSVGMLRARRAESVAKEERQLAVDEAEKATAVVDFLVDVLASPDPKNEGREVRVVDVLDLAAERYGARFADEPDVRARLAAALGNVYGGLGLDDESEEQLALALETLRSLHPDGRHPDVVNVLRRLGDRLIIVGRLDEADERLAEARRLERALPGIDAASVATDPSEHRLQVSVGRLRLAQTRFEDAEGELRAGIAGLDRTLGPDHREALLARNSLAGLLHETERFDEAETLYGEALDGLSVQLGDEHPDTVRLRFNYAALLYVRGKTEPAIEQFRELLEVRERVLGPDHPETLAVTSNLAAMLRLQGHMDEAEVLLTEALERVAQGPEHPVVQSLSVNLANLCYHRGDYVRAEDLWGRVYVARAATFGDDHEQTLKVLFDLARAARLREDHEAAEERARRGLEASSRVFGADHHFTFEFQRELGRTLVRLERYVEAEEVLLASLQSYRAAKPGIEWLQGPEPQLVALYDGWGRPADADPYRDSGSTGEPPY